jgi:hypothetical protein
MVEYLKNFSSGVNVGGCNGGKSLGLLSRDFRTFFSRFGEANGNGLLTALHFAAPPTFAGAKSPVFFPAHCAGDTFACGFTVPSAS